MQTRRTVAMLFGALALAGAGVAGCSDEEAERDVREGARDAEQGAKDAGREAADEGGEIKRDAEKELND